MEQKDYDEAYKKVQAIKPRDNYLVIEMSYDKKIVLPYKDGLAFMAALSYAEQLNTPYNERHSIKSLETDGIQSRIMSYQEYQRYKIAALLNIEINDVKLYEMAA